MTLQHINTLCKSTASVREHRQQRSGFIFSPATSDEHKITPLRDDGRNPIIPEMRFIQSLRAARVGFAHLESYASIFSHHIDIAVAAFHLALPQVQNL